MPLESEPTASTAEATPQMRLQILSTEHWSLLASRNLAWNESFTRASMFLSTLSFAVVALALVGQASGFDETFRLFALVVLPVVLFVGLATMLRMESANYHDAMCVIGMNRIRAAYLQLAPDLRRHFVMGSTDDVRGIGVTMAPAPGHPVLLNFIAASPTLISVLCSMLVAAIVALVLIQIGAGRGPAFIGGAVAFLVAFGAWAFWTRRQLLALMRSHQPIFPGEEG
jgi:hypothetical protein